MGGVQTRLDTRLDGLYSREISPSRVRMVSLFSLSLFRPAGRGRSHVERGFLHLSPPRRGLGVLDLDPKRSHRHHLHNSASSHWTRSLSNGLISCLYGGHNAISSKQGPESRSKLVHSDGHTGYSNEKDDRNYEGICVEFVPRFDCLGNASCEDKDYGCCNMKRTNASQVPPSRSIVVAAAFIRLTYPRDRFGLVLSMIRIPLPEERKRRKEKSVKRPFCSDMSLASDARTRLRVYLPGEVVEIIAFET